MLFVICDKGFEDQTALEVKEILGLDTKIQESIVYCPATKQQVAYFSYKSQSAIKVLYGLAHCPAQNMLCECETIDYSNWITEKTPFRVLIKNMDVQEDMSEISAKIGSMVITKIPNAPVNLKNPQLILYGVIMNNTFYFGVDASGSNLAKREYRIFLGPASIRSTIAYHLVRLGNSPTSLLDPFCGSGIIPIEAGLYATKISPHHYTKESLLFTKWSDINLDEIFNDNEDIQQFPILGCDQLSSHIDAAKKNAKIAGIHKAIRLFRSNVDWIDMKLEDTPVIVTAPPFFSSIHDDQKAFQNIQQLTHRAKDVTSKIVILTNDYEKLIQATQKPFKPTHKRTIYIGKSELFAVVLEQK